MYNMSTDTCIHPLDKDINILSELLYRVEMYADKVLENTDPEDYIVTFHSYGQHDGELLLSHIRKLASNCFSDKNNTNADELLTHGYKVGPIEWNNGVWSIGALYTSRGAIYFNIV